MNVINSGVDKVTFNNGSSTLNIRSHLFEDTLMMVNKPESMGELEDIYNLDVTMWHGTSLVTSRYNQIKFLDFGQDFLAGNITVESNHDYQNLGFRKIKINSNNSVQITGFNADLAGTGATPWSWGTWTSRAASPPSSPASTTSPRT